MYLWSQRAVCNIPEYRSCLRSKASGKLTRLVRMMGKRRLAGGSSWPLGWKAVILEGRNDQPFWGSCRLEDQCLHSWRPHTLTSWCCPAESWLSTLSCSFVSLLPFALVKQLFFCSLKEHRSTSWCGTKPSGKSTGLAHKVRILRQSWT